jgi:hypothetical protein
MNENPQAGASLLAGLFDRAGKLFFRQVQQCFGAGSSVFHHGSSISSVGLEAIVGLVGLSQSVWCGSLGWRLAPINLCEYDIRRMSMTPRLDYYFVNSSKLNE